MQVISGGKRIFSQLSDFSCPRRCINIPSSLVNSKTESIYKLQRCRINRTFPQTSINAGIKGPSGEVSRKSLKYAKPIWSISFILERKSSRKGDNVLDNFVKC